MWKKIVIRLLNPKWVVFNDPESDNPELGLQIWGITFGYFRGRIIPYDNACNVRAPKKREFGESLHAPRPSNIEKRLDKFIAELGYEPEEIYANLS